MLLFGECCWAAFWRVLFGCFLESVIGLLLGKCCWAAFGEVLLRTDVHACPSV